MKLNGTVKIGTFAALVVIPNGQTATWTHNNAEKAVDVAFVNAHGVANLVSTLLVTQPSANVITVQNGSGGSLSGVIRAVFADGAIGDVDVAASDASLVIA